MTPAAESNEPTALCQQLVCVSESQDEDVAASQEGAPAAATRVADADVKRLIGYCGSMSDAQSTRIKFYLENATTILEDDEKHRTEAAAEAHEQQTRAAHFFDGIAKAGEDLNSGDYVVESMSNDDDDVQVDRVIRKRTTLPLAAAISIAKKSLYVAGARWTDEEKGITWIWMPPGRLDEKYSIGRWTDEEKGITWIWMPPGRLNEKYSTCKWSKKVASELHPWCPDPLDGFWTMETPVTQGQYSCYHEAVRGSVRVFPSRSDLNEQDQELLPVQGLSYKSAFDFSVWAGGRLPTFWEWLYAASSGGVSKYPWGDNSATVDHAVYDKKEAKDGREPVGKKGEGKTKFGLFDMAGNVWELTSTTVSFEDNIDRRIVVGGAWHVGENAHIDRRIVAEVAWHVGENALLNGARAEIDLMSSPYDVGFRCVR